MITTSTTSLLFTLLTLTFTLLPTAITRFRTETMLRIIQFVASIEVQPVRLLIAFFQFFRNLLFTLGLRLGDTTSFDTPLLVTILI